MQLVDGLMLGHLPTPFFAAKNVWEVCGTIPEF
jgi:hypothetical protein